MTDVRTAPSVGDSSRPAELPEGRYGRSAAGDEARTDRRLKVLGGVLGAVFLAVIGWFGVSYIADQGVSGELIKFQVVSDGAVEAHLEVRKDAGAEGVCTIRAQEESSREVGRKAVRIKGGDERQDRVVSIRTTARATSAELTGCEVTGSH